MTHFAYSNESSQDYSYKQFGLFKTIVKALNYDFKYIHMNNTDASLKFDDGGFCGYARSGLGLIGFSSFDSQLKSIVALYSCLISIKEIKVKLCRIWFELSKHRKRTDRSLADRLCGRLIAFK